jgi:CheY-like chemotaxis protein
MSTETSDFVILVAEDNPADVALVREALKEHRVNCVLHVVNDGAQAIAFIDGIDVDPKKPRLDLILLDLHLPSRDGEEIVKRLRSTERNAQTPVIVMSGSDSPTDRRKAEKYALFYFRKPSRLAEFTQLGAIVASVLADAAESARRLPTPGAQARRHGGQ